MRVHHLDCAPMREIEPADGPGRPLRAVGHVLLIETDSSGLVLVDAGIGLGDIERPSERLLDDWLEMAGPTLDPPRRPSGRSKRSGTRPATSGTSSRRICTATTRAG